MFVGEICNRQVVICQPEDSIQQAVELMRNNHVGDVIVVEHKLNMHFPVGILTDRDIVIEVMAEGADAKSITVKDVMSSELISVREDDHIIETIEKMSDAQVVIGCDVPSQPRELSSGGTPRRGERIIPAVVERGELVFHHDRRVVTEEQGRS